MKQLIRNRKKILLSILSGIVFCFITWIYLNSFYTFSAEDSFFSKTAFLIFKVRPPHIPESEKMIFINTGKDIALINDTAWGQVAVSDRDLVAQLIEIINRKTVHAKFTVLDLQFYYPYSINLAADSVLQNLLNQNRLLSIPVLLDQNDRVKRPLYDASYSVSDYKTYGYAISKFKLYYNDIGLISTPLKIYQEVNHANWKHNGWFSTENKHLMLNYIWPFYYFDEASLKQKTFNIGELLYQFKFDSSTIKKYLDDKIVFIGNFDQDIHNTAVGKMPGTIILANLYLNLVAGKQIVSYYWILYMLCCFSALSYFCWFGKFPIINFKFRFIFSHHLTDYLNGFSSFFGSMFLIGIISIFVFGIYVNIFLPTAMLSGIYYFVNKKYASDEH
jgi:hypothetical protein